jgi:hypothetical protein
MTLFLIYCKQLLSFLLYFIQLEVKLYRTAFVFVMLCIFLCGKDANWKRQRWIMALRTNEDELIGGAERNLKSLEFHEIINSFTDAN